MRKLIFAAALLLSVSMAHATYCKDGSLIASHPNGDCSKPIQPTAPTPTPTTSSSNAAATAAAAANSSAAAKSASTSQAAGGNASAAGGKSDASSSASGGTANGSQQLSGVGNDNSSTSFRALALSLPSPVFTPAMPEIHGCPSANVKQSADAQFWNGFSQARGETNTDNCAIVGIYNAYVQSCRWESARKYLDLYAAKLLSKFEPGSMRADYAALDLTPQECADWNRPAPPPTAKALASGPDYHIVDAPICPPAAPIPAKSKPKPKGKRVAMITECKVN